MDLSPFARVTRKVPAIVVGTLVDGGVEYTGLGTTAAEAHPEHLVWEIGSITKVFTGILLAEMSLRGEVHLDDPIGRHLPSDVSGRLPALGLQPTLTDLATHTAGLPRIPWAWLRKIRGSDNPYSTLTEQDVWDALGPRSRRPRKPKPRYSNFGVGLLGHLLGRAAGTDYGSVVMERVVTPLGMAATGIGTTPVVPGFRKSKPTPPWTFGAVAGAGALRSTAEDLITFAGACIDPPPGRLGEAIELARQPAWKGRIRCAGLGWQIRLGRPGQPPGETMWHDGGTYGGSSFIAIDPNRRIAVATLGNTGPGLLAPLDGPSWKVFDRLQP
jgi:CubicO group peptidase (beta-lactamase class C family)